jgi:hypothetical protein
MADILEKILICPDSGLIPFLDNTLGGNWNRFHIKPWFPRSTAGDREVGYRLRESTSVVEGDSRRTEQVMVIGKIFFLEDFTEGMVEAVRLQNDLDDAVKHWSKTCPYLLGAVEEFQGTAFGPEQNKNISGDREYAWAVNIIRQFSFSYYGDTRNEYCCD